MITKEDVITAIMGWPGLYETPDGRRFKGSPVSEVPTRLREARWKNVSRIDESDLRRLGLEVVDARYVGGARPKRFCRVVVVQDGPALVMKHKRVYRMLVDHGHTPTKAIEIVIDARRGDQDALGWVYLIRRARHFGEQTNA